MASLSAKNLFFLYFFDFFYRKTILIFIIIGVLFLWFAGIKANNYTNANLDALLSNFYLAFFIILIISIVSICRGIISNSRTQILFAKGLNRDKLFFYSFFIIWIYTSIMVSIFYGLLYLIWLLKISEGVFNIGIVILSLFVQLFIIVSLIFYLIITTKNEAVTLSALFIIILIAPVVLGYWKDIQTIIAPIFNNFYISNLNIRNIILRDNNSNLGKVMPSFLVYFLLMFYTKKKYSKMDF